MKNLLSVCPNPSIDVTVETQGLNIGGLNRISKVITTYSGKAVNVARGAARLGLSSVLSGFMFKENGDVFISDVEKSGIAVDAVLCPGYVRTNYKLAESSGRLTELNSKGESVSDTLQQELLKKLQSISGGFEVTVISGSLPAGVAESFYGDMIGAVKSKYIICDTEGEKLLSAVKRGVTLVKPNILELEQIENRKLNTKDEIIAAANSLISLGAKIVLVSLGSEGAIITDGKKIYSAKAPNVKPRSTVGAGDSMIAACVRELIKNSPLPEILLSAVAAGTAAVQSSGTKLFELSDYEILRQCIRGEEWG